MPYPHPMEPQVTSKEELAERALAGEDMEGFYEDESDYDFMDEEPDEEDEGGEA